MFCIKTLLGAIPSVVVNVVLRRFYCQPNATYLPSFSAISKALLPSFFNVTLTPTKRRANVTLTPFKRRARVTISTV